METSSTTASMTPHASDEATPKPWRREPRRRGDILGAAQQRGTKKWGATEAVGWGLSNRSGLERKVKQTDGDADEAEQTRNRAC